MPFADDPASQLANMERMRQEMTAADNQLDRAAEQSGGTVNDLGWRELSELTELPNKAQAYLLQASPGGFSIPYQQGDALHMIWVEARELPAELDYESVQAQVRKDYFERFERKLFQQAVSQRLSAANFVFSAENVRDRLLPAR